MSYRSHRRRFSTVTRLGYDIKLVGPLFDANYDVEVKTSASARSLQDLCVKKISSDASLFCRHVHEVSWCLRNLILYHALEEGLHDVLRILVDNWHNKLFQFPEVPVLRNWKFSCSSENFRNAYISFCLISRSAEIVLRAFFQRVSIATNLRLIDFSVMPFCEEITLEICRYVLENKLPTQNSTSSSSRSERDRCILKVHCSITCFEAVQLLYCAITAISRVQLVVCGLKYMYNSFCSARVLDLFRSIRPKDLRILTVDFEGLYKVEALLPFLCNFTNLEVLDFSHYHCYSNRYTNPHEIFCKITRELVCLSRLDYTNVQIGNHVSCILGQAHENPTASSNGEPCSTVNKMTKETTSPTDHQIPQRRNLEYLSFSGCDLKSSDMECLAKSPYVRTLKNLKLCKNPLGCYFDSFIVLLEALVPTLCILEIGGCDFRTDQISRIFSALVKMKKLLYLNITELEAPANVLISHFQKLTKLPSLATLNISVPGSVASGNKHWYRSCLAEVFAKQKVAVNLLWEN